MQQSSKNKMSDQVSSTYIYRVPVSQNDIDGLGHVNNIVYLRWVQEAAEAHWGVLSNDAVNQKYIWVVLRHEIDYHFPALLEDEIAVHTWVGKNDGARSERHTVLYNAAGKKLATALTTWCLLDASTKRPKRIDEEMMALFRQ
ncbi:MAG: acyl-CoA thioesterase [Chitinophagaceae bacterium]